MRKEPFFILAIAVILFFPGAAAATDLEITPVDDFNSSGPVGGPFAPSSKDYQLTNTGSSLIWWGVYYMEDWLKAEPEWGPLAASHSVTVTISLEPQAYLLGEGVYTDTLTFIDMTNDEQQSRDATLTIFIPGGIWVDPESFDVNVIETLSLMETLTIGNDGLDELNFTIRTRNLGGPGESMERTDDLSSTGNGGFSVSKDHDFTVVGDTPYKQGELIVRFEPKADESPLSMETRNQILSSSGGGTVTRNFSIVPGLSVVELPPGMTVEEALTVFNGAEGILYAQPNYEVKAISTFPDDTRFDELWGMHNTGQTGGTVDADIDAPEAWDIATGSDEIVVAVIDTGVDYTHPDLAANMWVNEAELNGDPSQDDDGNGYVDDIYGYDFCNNDGNPMDDHYHGTHCAGTIGAVGNNNQGVAGVCWDVRIMALKFLDSGGRGWSDDAISCIQYSVLMGADLSSNSWGGGSYNQGLKDAIDAAGAVGMLFVAAAGNNGDNTDTDPHYPSSYDCESLISVMATNHYDNKSSFSNYGPISVDLGAPGSDILSCEPGAGYRYLDGTSMATPHVAGACALLWSMNPAMTNTEVKNILLQTVDETLTGLCVSEGRLNLYNAILETKAPWIEIEPEEGTVGPGDSNDISVTFNAAQMEPGTYEAEIIIILDDPCDTTINIPVTMTVEPDDLEVSPADNFESSGTRGGPFAPACMTYTLTNNGDEPLNWTTSQTQDWLDVDPNQGILDFGESIDVNVCITTEAELLDPNIYSQTLIFQNADSGVTKSRSVSLMVNPPDCFTESFDDSDNDLHNLSLTFSPDGSVAYYEVCRERVDEFSTDPNGGITAALGDDDFAEVVLTDDVNISFYGVSYDRFYIGSNGYITFGGGDTEYEALLENHFSLPRISGLFADLTPPDIQCISYKQLDDRVAVTFEEVPLYGDKDAKNSFQIEIFFVDETIRITWLGIEATGGIAGLSEGYGFPATFIESNLSRYPPCWPYCDFDRDYSVDMNDLAVFVSYWLDMDCNVPYWCGKTDLDFSSTVEMADYAICAESWLVKDYWWLEPVAHWKFDEGQGDTAYDSSGNGNDGTLIGPPSWVSGKVGNYALDFDGVDDYVETAVINLDNVSVSAWIKVSEEDGLYSIVGNWESGGYGLSYNKYDNNEFHFSVHVNGAYRSVFSNATVQLDRWYYIVGTYDGDNGYMHVDGIKQADSFAVSGTISSSVCPVMIGADPRSGQDPISFFNGLIDDVRIYDRALSAEEILVLYWQGQGAKAFNPEPADGAGDVDPNTALIWTAGYQALSHDVYLGTDYNDVNDANTFSDEYKGNFDVNSYDPCGLDFATTYYWRIDEKNAFGTAKGDVWSFTTWNVNPVAWWEFEEGTGGIAYDSSGNGHDGTLGGPPDWVAGKVGDYALDFGGVVDYVDIPYDSNLDIDPLDGITVVAWIKLDSYPDSGHQGPILGLYDSDDPGTKNYLAINKSIYGNTINWDQYPPSGGNLASIKPDLNVWYHIAVVQNSTYGAIYINGVLDSSDNSPEAYTGDIPDTIRIGSRADGKAAYYFDGTIDDVRIYDRVLSAEEIEALYQAGVAP